MLPKLSALLLSLVETVWEGHINSANLWACWTQAGLGQNGEFLGVGASQIFPLSEAVYNLRFLLLQKTTNCGLGSSVLFLLESYFSVGSRRQELKLCSSSQTLGKLSLGSIFSCLHYARLSSLEVDFLGADFVPDFPTSFSLLAIFDLPCVLREWFKEVKARGCRNHTWGFILICRDLRIRKSDSHVPRFCLLANGCK